MPHHSRRRASRQVNKEYMHHLIAILIEPSCLELWRAGRITGWIEALMENAPQTFRSVLPEEHMIAL